MFFFSKRNFVPIQNNIDLHNAEKNFLCRPKSKKANTETNKKERK